VAQGSAVVDGSPAPSTTQPAVPAGGATIDVPAEESGALTASLPLSPPDPRHGGDAGRMVAVLIALAAVIGAGSGVLARQLRRLTPDVDVL
jgi:hypothetical protein